MLDLVKAVKKAQKGNDEAFLTLFQNYEEEIYKMAYIYVNDQNDALDVVQETACRSFKRIKSLKEPKYFKTWVIRIAINCALDILRKEKKMVRLKPEIADDLPEHINEDIDFELTVRDLIKT